jgi:hypothetical protein
MEQVRLTKQSIRMKLRKNMKIASDLMNILGRVIHAGRRMITKTTADEQDAIALSTRANCMGGSKSSFNSDLEFQP